MSHRIIQADCLDALADLDPVDAVVTDPPYGLSFMGKDWDHGVPGVRFWEAIAAAMKPGAHLLAFGGTRTFHQLACAIEDAGFEIRDCVMWVYGTGFPKSHDVSKAIDRKLGAEDQRTFKSKNPSDRPYHHEKGETSTGWRCPVRPDKTNSATDEAKQWDGWGTALKPSWEPIIVARKPFDGTVAANVLEHGTGALNIDGCRVSMSQADEDFIRKTARPNTAGQNYDGAVMNLPAARTVNVHDKGRWPANLIHDGSDEVVGLFPENGGSAARFFYCAKASKSERGEGNDHPTVKPLALMRYLCRLVTPPGGIILDPFMGSGSTLVAAEAEGFRSVGIDLEANYCKIAETRLRRAAK